MSSSKRQTIETWLAALELRLPKPTPEPIALEVAAAFHDAALACARADRLRQARETPVFWATAVAADLAAGLPARLRFAIGVKPTVGERSIGSWPRWGGPGSAAGS